MDKVGETRMVKVNKKRVALILLTVVFVVGLGAFGFISAGGQSNDVEGGKVIPVVKADIQIATTADGRAVADSIVNLGFATGGTVSEIYVEEGQSVKKGQKLAKLDSRKSAAQLSQAKAGYSGALAKLGALKDRPSDAEVAGKRAVVENAEIALADMQADYSYTLDEYKAGRLSKEQLMSKEAQLHNAEAQLDSAEAQLNVLSAGPSSATVSSKQTAVTNAQIAVDDAQKAYDYALDESNASTSTSSALIDKVLLKESQLNSAKAQLDSAQAQLSIALEGATSAEITSKQVAINNAKIALTDAQSAYDYTYDAYKAGRLSREQLSAKDTQLNNAKAQLRTAEAQLEITLEPVSSSEISSARASVNQAGAVVQGAEAALDEATLLSPVDGVVLAVNGKEGETAGGQSTGGTAEPFMVIGNVNRMMIEAQVEEIDIAKISIRQKIRAAFDALEGEEFYGSVESIEGRAKVDQNGVVTYQVRVVVDNKTNKIKDGMTAHVDFIIKEARDVLTIPVKAVTRTNGKPTVTIHGDAGKSVVKEIEVGMTDGSSVEVKHGLSLGEKVVIKEEEMKE